MLRQELFKRMDESPDALFYEVPRLVTHIDDAAIAAVTQLYRDYFPVGGAILDLMSSWVSHLPEEVTYRRVVGLGMNAAELAANSRLHTRVVQDLNEDPHLPFADGEFDAGGICVSVDYLIHPVEVLRECGRVIIPGGPLVITFSNRCFPTKAIAAWQMLDDEGHQRLVEQFFEAAGNWTQITPLDRSPGLGHDPLYAVVPSTAQDLKKAHLGGNGALGRRGRVTRRLSDRRTLVCGPRHGPALPLRDYASRCLPSGAASHLDLFDILRVFPIVRDRKDHTHDLACRARSPDEERHAPRGARPRERAPIRSAHLRATSLRGGSSSSACRSSCRRCRLRSSSATTRALCPRSPFPPFARWATRTFVPLAGGLGAWVAEVPGHRAGVNTPTRSSASACCTPAHAEVTLPRARPAHGRGRGHGHLDTRTPEEYSRGCCPARGACRGVSWLLRLGERVKRPRTRPSSSTAAAARARTSAPNVRKMWGCPSPCRR